MRRNLKFLATLTISLALLINNIFMSAYSSSQLAEIVGGESIDSGFNWYSDSNTVSFYEDTPSIKLETIYTADGFTRNIVEDWINTASNEWNEEIPISFISGSSASTKINVRAARPSTIYDNFAMDMVGSNGLVANGKARTWRYNTVVDIIEIDDIERTIKHTSRAELYVANKLTNGVYEGGNGDISFNKRSIEGHKNTTKHEIGHGLGWSGHSTDEDDLMAPSTIDTALMSCTSRDYNQITQFMDVYNDSTPAAHNASLEANVTDRAEDVITTAERINAIKNATGFVHNVIIGTPVEKIQGSSEVVPVVAEESIVYLTDYVFEVKDYAYGAAGKERITVRSQVGDVFEIGKEYTFAARHLNSVYYDQYNVNSHSWILNNEEASGSELESFHSAIRALPAPKRAEPTVILEATPTKEYIDSVDVVIIATVTGTVQEELDNDNLNAKLELKEILKGELKKGVLDEYVRLKGDVAVGETYMIHFNADTDGNLTLSARKGAIIAENNALFISFSEALK